MAVNSDGFLSGDTPLVVACQVPVDGSDGCGDCVHERCRALMNRATFRAGLLDARRNRDERPSDRIMRPTVRGREGLESEFGCDLHRSACTQPSGDRHSVSRDGNDSLFRIWAENVAVFADDREEDHDGDETADHDGQDRFVSPRCRGCTFRLVHHADPLRLGRDDLDRACRKSDACLLFPGPIVASKEHECRGGRGGCG